MPSPRERVTVALDTPDLDRALEWAAAVRDHVGGLKLGLEFLTANGPAGVARVAAIGLPLFLDVKFHDIPNTVAGAIGGACRLGAAIVNVHAAGGAAMLAAAAAAARETTSGRPKIIAVTVLTSLDEEDLRATGQHGPVAEQVLRLAALAQGVRPRRCRLLAARDKRSAPALRPRLPVGGARHPPRPGRRPATRSGS